MAPSLGMCFEKDTTLSLGLIGLSSIKSFFECLQMVFLLEICLAARNGGGTALCLTSFIAYNECLIDLVSTSIQDILLRKTHSSEEWIFPLSMLENCWGEGTTLSLISLITYNECLISLVSTSIQDILLRKNSFFRSVTSDGNKSMSYSSCCI